MEKALENISLLLGREVVELWRKRFERVQQMPGASQKFGRIAATADKEQLRDYLTEIKFALIFTGLGFQVEIEPKGKKGPDLKISRDRHDTFVEIKHLRYVYPGPPELLLSDKSPTLSEYGNIERDKNKAYNNILKKFRQVDNEDSIIVFWNDDEDMEEIEVGEAVSDLRRDITQQRFPIPSGLSFVLYCSNWIRTGNQYQLYNPQQFYCFPLQAQSKSHHIIWMQELEGASVSELIERALNQVA